MDYDADVQWRLTNAARKAASYLEQSLSGAAHLQPTHDQTEVARAALDADHRYCAWMAARRPGDAGDGADEPLLEGEVLP